MLLAMGGLNALRGIDAIAMSGDGTRNRLGQIAVTGGIDPDAVLSGMTETIDFVNGHAAFDHDVLIGEGGFSQHRTEALTTWQGQKVGWGTTVGRPNEASSVNGLFSWATQNTPVMLMRRNPVSAAIAADNVGAGQRAQSVTWDGRPHWAIVTDMDGEEITLMIDQDSGFLSGFTALDTETMLGDVEAEYYYSDYRPVGDVMLPFANVVLKEGEPYSSMTYSDIRINDADSLAIFDIPEDVQEEADQVVASNGSWVPLAWNPVSDTVTHIVAFSHHSMVVEFPSFVVVVEGPYTEGQSLTLARMIEENIGKPIRYVVPTHPHHDHTGGLRGLAASGASVLAATGHEDEIRGIIESPHTNPPDALALRAALGAEVGQVEVFSDITEVREDDQVLRLYEVTTIPHVNPMVLAWVENDGILFQSDLYFGGPGPDAVALAQAVSDLGLQGTQVVGGHGGVLPFAGLMALLESEAE
jgi:glyoxylase-like metal-dependent hydrolase (beta-lactamase superfamily II)